MYLDELDEKYTTMFYGIGDFSDEKGVKDVRRFACYPPFPWEGGEHLMDDPKLFWEACQNAGLVRNVRKEDIEQKYEPTITYEQWLAKHQNEPGFVNHMTDGGLNEYL